MLKWIVAIVLIYCLFSCNNNDILANDLDLTIDNDTTGGDLDIVQDGENNDIDFDIISMDGFIISLNQIGDSNAINVDVDGRTSNGSSVYINQTGNNKSYSNTLWCGHTFCTLTVNQN